MKSMYDLMSFSVNYGLVFLFCLIAVSVPFLVLYPMDEKFLEAHHHVIMGITIVLGTTVVWCGILIGLNHADKVTFDLPKTQMIVMGDKIVPYRTGEKINVKTIKHHEHFTKSFDLKNIRRSYDYDKFEQGDIVTVSVHKTVKPTWIQSIKYIRGDYDHKSLKLHVDKVQRLDKGLLDDNRHVVYNSNN